MQTLYFQSHSAFPATPAPAGGQVLRMEFTNQSSLEFTHNLGRTVLAQVYLNTGQQIYGAIKQVTPNMLEVSFLMPLSGTLVVY